MEHPNKKYLAIELYKSDRVHAYGPFDSKKEAEELIQAMLDHPSTDYKTTFLIEEEKGN